MSGPQFLLAVLALVVSVGVLQVFLDRRARRAPKNEDIYLHLETTGFGPAVFDQEGRRLRKLRHLRYNASIGAADSLVLDVLCHDGQSYFTQGRRIGGKP